MRRLQYARTFTLLRLQFVGHIRLATGLGYGQQIENEVVVISLWFNPSRQPRKLDASLVTPTTREVPSGRLDTMHHRLPTEKHPMLNLSPHIP